VDKFSPLTRDFRDVNPSDLSEYTTSAPRNFSGLTEVKNWDKRVKRSFSTREKAHELWKEQSMAFPANCFNHPILREKDTIEKN